MSMSPWYKGKTYEELMKYINTSIDEVTNHTLFEEDNKYITTFTY